MRRAAIAGVVVILDPWHGWALVLLWAAAAAVLFAHGRLPVRFAAAGVLWLAGTAAYFH